MNKILLRCKKDKSTHTGDSIHKYSISISIVLLVPLCTAQVSDYTSQFSGVYGDADVQATEKDQANQGGNGQYGDVKAISEQISDMPVDMSDESTGNWYEKLRFLKSAKVQYDELNTLLQSIKEQEGTFSIQLKKMQEQIANFYTRVRINPQVLPETLDKLLTELKPIQERVPTTEEERLELVEAADKQKALEQLRQEFDLLQKVYADFAKAYTKDSMAQLKQAEQYQERALDSFGQLEETRSHEKAHELYKIVENSKENILCIAQYLKNLDAYGVQVQAKVQQLMGRIQASIEHLEKQGISVRYVTEQEKAQLLAEQQKQQEQERLKKEQREREKAERDRWASMPWYQKFFEYMRQAGVWVLSQFKRS